MYVNKEIQKWRKSRIEQQSQSLPKSKLQKQVKEKLKLLLRLPSKFLNYTSSKFEMVWVGVRVDLATLYTIGLLVKNRSRQQEHGITV